MIESIVSAGVELVKMSVDLIGSAVNAKNEDHAAILERLQSAIMVLRGTIAEVKQEIADRDKQTEEDLKSLVP